MFGCCCLGNVGWRWCLKDALVVEVMFWWCLRHFGWFLGRVLVVSQSSFVSVMLWWCLGHVLVVSRSCFDGALVMFGWGVCFVWAVFWF